MENIKVKYTEDDHEMLAAVYYSYFPTIEVVEPGREAKAKEIFRNTFGEGKCKEEK
jgi:hypothetical protein